MPWLLDYRLRRSPKNGLILCRRLFGQWTVFVDGIMQTSPYVTAMWCDALARLPADCCPRRLLLLGLGAGGIVPELRRRWPGAELVAVEWDETMAQLASKLRIYKPADAPLIKFGDAREVVPSMTEEFDLVMFDLFTGHQPALTAADEAFAAAIAARVAPSGCLLVNAYLKPSLLGLFAKHVPPVTDWQWKYNRLGLFRRT